MHQIPGKWYVKAAGIIKIKSTHTSHQKPFISVWKSYKLNLYGTAPKPVSPWSYLHDYYEINFGAGLKLNRFKATMFTSIAPARELSGLNIWMQSTFEKYDSLPSGQCSGIGHQSELTH